MKAPQSAPDPIPERFVPTLRRGGYALTKVSRKMLKLFESGIDEAELEKGRRMARRGIVVRFQTKAGLISGELESDKGDGASIRVAIRCTLLSQEFQELFIQRAAATAAATGAMLNKQIHPSLLEPIDGVGIIPTKADVSSVCGLCKDAPNCRHIGAIHALLADFLNEDELLLLRWRGFCPAPESDTGDYPANTGGIIDLLRESRGWPKTIGEDVPTGSAAPSWNQLPELPHLPEAPPQEVIPVIEQLGLPPFFPESERNLLTTLRRLQEDA